MGPTVSIPSALNLLPMPPTSPEGSFHPQDSGDKGSPFLNIYCDYEPGSEYNLDSIAGEWGLGGEGGYHRQVLLGSTCVLLQRAA